MFNTYPKHSPMLATVKKTDSTTAKTSPRFKKNANNFSDKTFNFIMTALKLDI